MFEDTIITGIPNIAIIGVGVLLVIIVIIIILVLSKNKKNKTSENVSILDVKNEGVPSETEKGEFSYGYEKEPTMVMNPVSPDTKLEEDTKLDNSQITVENSNEVEENSDNKQEMLNATIPSPTINEETNSLSNTENVVDSAENKENSIVNEQTEETNSLSSTESVVESEENKENSIANEQTEETNLNITQDNIESTQNVEVKNDNTIPEVTQEPSNNDSDDFESVN